jgi:hypothetical protein
MAALGNFLSRASKKSAETLFLFAANAMLLFGSKLFVVLAVDTEQLFHLISLE